MATTGLSIDAKKYSTYVSGQLVWSNWVSATGTNTVWANYNAYVFHRVNLYKGTDVQSLTSVTISVPLVASSGATDVGIQVSIFTSDVTGGSSWPSGGRAGTSETIGYLYGSRTHTCTISLSGITANTIYIGYRVNYSTGAVSVDTGNTSITETYTAKALPQISFGTIKNTSTGFTIPINNGSNYTLTCTITAGNTTTPGNNAQLYSGTSSNGQFKVPVNAVTWFNTAGITNSLSIPITVTVTGGNQSTLTGYATYTESRTSAKDSMKPVFDSVTTQIQQAAGAATTYYPSTYIAGYSKCKVKAVISRPTNATISTVKFSYSGGATVNMPLVTGYSRTYAGTTTTALTKNTTFTVTATDSRGLSNTTTVSVTGVVAYVLPSVSIDLAYRCDDQGEETDGGDHYRIRVTAQYSTNLQNNSITELTVGLKNAPAVERHNITSGTTSSAFGTLSDPKRAYVITVIIQDKISGQITAEYTLKGKQRDLVLNHDGGYTHLGVGMTPVGKDYSGYKDTIELPNDGLFLMGGIPVQAFKYPHIAGKTSDNPGFGHDFHNVSADRTGEANATAIFGFPASDYDNWSNIPDDPLDQQSAGIQTLGWIGWREVYYCNQDIVLVKITEVAPQAGRIWFCSRAKNSSTQQYTWTHWKYLMPTTV